MGDNLCTGNLFFTDDTGEFKHLSYTTGNPTPDVSEYNDVPSWSKSNEASFNLAFSVKNYSYKRFKKLLMSRGIQRNLAGKISRIYTRNDISLLYWTTN